MLSPETLAAYREMSVSDRMAFVLELITAEAPHLLDGVPEVVDRRFELLRRQNEDRDRRMLEGIARSCQTDE